MQDGAPRSAVPIHDRGRQRREAGQKACHCMPFCRQGCFNQPSLMEAMNSAIATGDEFVAELHMANKLDIFLL